jgi:ATP-dependent helicase/nuclease subunit A
VSGRAKAAAVAVATPTRDQLRAADPLTSAWVTASAGTGKTRVLADRVLRLLLADADPERILCLTFTKAAAAEMVTRIQGDLADFAAVGAAELEARLVALLGRAPNEAERERARILFARVLDLPGGLPVMTIHAFCQALLARFPIEAGVAPHFGLIEERDSKALLHEAREEVLARRDADTRAALARLATLLADQSLGEALAEVSGKRLRLAALLAEHGDIETIIARVHAVLGVSPGEGEEEMRRAACTDPALGAAGLLRAAAVLAGGSGGDRERAALIEAWLAADADGRLAAHTDYERVFLTRDREPRKSILTAQTQDPAGVAATILLAEQQRLLGWLERQRAAAIAERTTALLRVGWLVLEAYEEKKRARAALDFDDLIERAQRLLATPGMAPWVQYKLDQRVEHLLVDEGQDTSPAQWAVITALIDDFFSGAGAHASQRTLFVVGDEKQSIFSFQGADLDTFQRLREELRRRAARARHPWREETLGRSFRSSPAVLEVVDRIFAPDEVRAGVASGPAWPRHESAREAAPGVVEVWPLLPVEPQARPDGWELPDAPQPQVVPERLLAQAIAIQIQRWINDGTPVPSTGLPTRAGDIMVLLPRRGILQDQLVRALKQYNVPVAGADRLALLGALPVKDLMALGDWLLLPEDDLTFAALLRSPLIGLGDQWLEALALGRGRMPLHRWLREQAAAAPELGEAQRRVEELRRLGEQLSPFELYARVLVEGGGLERFLARLGPQAIDPIEAFLAQAQAFERSHPPSLLAFLHWLRADAGELARDPDQPRDEVRVLTVHGAKGLEAPIVFVADTTTTPQIKDCLLWRDGDGLPLWKGGKALRDRQTQAAFDEAWRRQLEEQRRLLYVALTRARDRLIVAGWAKRGNSSEPTWQELVEAGMERAGAQRVEISIGEVRGQGWRLASGQPAAAPQPDLFAAVREPLPDLPAFARTAAPAGTGPVAPLRPSALGDAAKPGGGPDAERRFRRGLLIHRLLQTLADRPPAARAAALERTLAGVAAEEREGIAAEVGTVLGEPALAPLFAPGSLAEVTLAGEVAGVPVAGQVDRLVVGPDRVLVVDYKTDREPPRRSAEVPLAYRRQMAAYRALLRQIYPDREVACALLWTREARLMPLDPALLEAHAPGAGSEAAWQPLGRGA